jgi:hypothetical protein
MKAKPEPAASSGVSGLLFRGKRRIFSHDPHKPIAVNQQQTFGAENSPGLMQELFPVEPMEGKGSRHGRHRVALERYSFSSCPNVSNLLITYGVGKHVPRDVHPNYPFCY